MLGDAPTEQEVFIVRTGDYDEDHGGFGLARPLQF
jgi:hypothetical protein